MAALHVHDMAHLFCKSETARCPALHHKLCRGQASNGELGYGPAGKKSSANPDKVQALEGVHTHQVACGIGHTLFLVAPGSKEVSHSLKWAPPFNDN